MQKILSIGGFHIYLFGITVALGLLAGYCLAYKEAKRKGFDEDIFNSLVFFIILFSIIGARIYYVVVFNWKYYSVNLWDIFMIRNGGLSIQGGILGGILAGVFYLRFKKISFMDYVDAFIPGLAFGQFIGRIGCDVYGIPMKTSYPWGMVIGNNLVHPVQIYESLLNLVLFAFLWRRRISLKYKGQLLVEYLIGFALIRGGVEFYRDNPIWFGTLTVAHLTSLIMLIIGIVLYYIFRNEECILEERHTVINNKESKIFYFYILLIGILATYLFYLIRG